MQCSPQSLMVSLYIVFYPLERKAIEDSAAILFSSLQSYDVVHNGHFARILFGRERGSRRFIHGVFLDRTTASLDRESLMYCASSVSCLCYTVIPTIGGKKGPSNRSKFTATTFTQTPGLLQFLLCLRPN